MVAARENTRQYIAELRFHTLTRDIRHQHSGDRILMPALSQGGNLCMGTESIASQSGKALVNAVFSCGTPI
jgi:hypothetical protein